MPKILKIQNTLTGKKETFKPLNPDKVMIYCCGPTVQGYTHVGNARAALTLDLVSRVLNYLGYKIEVARNFTDVDDKIIASAVRENKTAQEVSEFYIEAYLKDVKSLGALLPHHMPKVTESMEAIIEFIADLETKGIAYKAQTQIGTDVFFSVEKFPRYGCLSHRKVEEMVAGSRIEVEEAKRHPADFALWKAAKPGEPSWPSPWGQGRPGWHIECSAMIQKIFGKTIDIHMGGIDLLFPHHENEIAQSEARHETALANYWIHNGLLELGHEKMSKSLGNIVTTRKFLESRHPEVLRLLFLQQHYRSPLDFSDENIDRAEALLERLYHCKKLALKAAGKAQEMTDEWKQKAEDSISDDFNTAKILGLILSEARSCFRLDSHESWSRWSAFLPFMNDVFGLLRDEPDSFLKANHERKLRRLGITEAEAQKVSDRLKEREKLRAEKKFQESDAVRAELESQGFVIMDGPDGSSWTKR